MGFPTENCTLSTCPLAYGQVEYQPNLGGNVFFTALFGIAILLQTIFGIRYRTWGFLSGMFCGLVLEVVGYAARIEMHFNPFTKGPFVMYLVALTIVPTFFTASIYLCLSRIIVLLGENVSRFKPRTYTICFISSDVVSLILQAAGGAIASGAQTESKKQIGIDIMVAGLAFQVASLLVFKVLCADYARAIRGAGAESRTSVLRSSKRFGAFLWTLALATLTIFIRSCFRVAELSQGFGSALANNEKTFMVLEGGMVAAAVTLLTIWTPGVVFGEVGWRDAAWTLSGKDKGRDLHAVPVKSGDSVGT